MRKFTGNTWRLAAVALGLSLLIACGGSPTTPSTGNGGGSAGTSGATMTIGSNGTISPSSVTITVGQSVTFVNNDSRSHEMASNPHPAHTDCPAINALGVIAAGQTKQTNALTTARSCGFHDHQDPTNGNLQGTITIR